MDLAGFLPVRIRPAAPTPLVTWLNFRGALLSEPFFYQTVEAVKSLPGFPEWGFTGIDEIIGVGNRLPSVTPSGLIFHVSRCGSTLLANICRAAPNTVVVSEAAPINGSFFPRLGYLDPAPCDPDERAILLDSLVRIYACHPDGNAKRVIVKFTSWNILWWCLIRRLWPDVPSIVVIRDPVEVMVSNLLRPSGWMRSSPNDGSNIASVFAWADSEPASMEREEFCARGLGTFYRAALEMLTDTCRVITYEQLNATRLRAAAAFLGCAVSTDVSERVCRYYSKDAAQRRPFEDDRAEKNRRATDSLRSLAERWVLPIDRQLRQLAIW